MVFPKDEFRKFSKEGNGSYVFDFSRIRDDDFKSILYTIVKNCENDITSITFSLDLFYETYKSDLSVPAFSQKPREKEIFEPVSLETSAFRKCKKFVQALIIAIKFIFKKARNLKNFIFKSFYLPKHELISLITSLESMSQIESLSFVNTPLYEDPFRIAVSVLKNKKLSEIHFNQCGLTDSSIDDIRSILNSNIMSQKQHEEEARLNEESIKVRGIQLVDLRNNEFSYRIISGLCDLFQSLPCLTLDLRENQNIDSQIIRNIQRSLPQIHIIANNMKMPKRTNTNCQEDVVVIDKDLKIVGKRAKEFYEAFSRVIELAEDLAK